MQSEWSKGVRDACQAILGRLLGKLCSGNAGRPRVLGHRVLDLHGGAESNLVSVCRASVHLAPRTSHGARRTHRAS